MRRSYLRIGRLLILRLGRYRPARWFGCYGEWVADRLFWWLYWIQRERVCGEVGCTRRAIPCYFSDDFLAESPQVSEYLCPDHAARAGYCRLCGAFEGGTEGFEFSHPGYCESCSYELEESLEADSYDEDLYYDAEAECEE